MQVRLLSGAFYLQGGSKLTIAVVVPTHNYADRLGRALTSIRLQTTQPDEIVVVDDASSDHPETMAADYGARYLRVDAENPLRARETGFLATTADYLVFLDADDELSPGYLAEGLAILKDDRSIGLAYSDILQINDGTGHKSYLRMPPYNRLRLECANYLHPACMVRRTALQLSQAFQQYDRRDYHEDWLMWKKVTGVGFSAAAMCENYLIWHRHDRNRSQAIEQADYCTQYAMADEPISAVVACEAEGQFARYRSWYMQSQLGKLGEVGGSHSFHCFGQRMVAACRWLTYDFLWIISPTAMLASNSMFELLAAFDHKTAAVRGDGHAMIRRGVATEVQPYLDPSVDPITHALQAVPLGYLVKQI